MHVEVVLVLETMGRYCREMGGTRFFTTKAAAAAVLVVVGASEKDRTEVKRRGKKSQEHNVEGSFASKRHSHGISPTKTQVLVSKFSAAHCSTVLGGEVSRMKTRKKVHAIVDGAMIDW